MTTYYRYFIQAGDGVWTGNGVCFASREDAETSARDLESRWLLVTAWKVEKTDGEGLTIHGKPIVKGAGHRVQL